MRRPLGYLTFKNQRNDGWSVWTITCSPYRYGRRVWAAQKASKNCFLKRSRSRQPPLASSIRTRCFCESCPDTSRKARRKFDNHLRRYIPIMLDPYSATSAPVMPALRFQAYETLSCRVRRIQSGWPAGTAVAKSSQNAKQTSRRHYINPENAWLYLCLGILDLFQGSGTIDIDFERAWPHEVIHILDFLNGKFALAKFTLTPSFSITAMISST